MCPRPRGWGWGQGARTTPDVAEANCLGRWVIYEVLKSIFEAVIYLRALSLNKHRICLIIVTVETQHPNGLASAAASPCPAQLRPGPGAPVSTQLHPSGLPLPGAPSHPPSRFSLLLRLTQAHSCSHQRTPLQRICQEQRHRSSRRVPHLLHPSGGCRIPRGPLAWELPRVVVTLIQPGSGDSCKVTGTFSG